MGTGIESNIDLALKQVATATFWLDGDGMISQSSQLFDRYVGAINDRHFFDCFTVFRPSSARSTEGLYKSAGQMALLVDVEEKFAIRGQFIRMESSNNLMFVGSPWLSWITQNKPDLPLKLDDFSSADVQLDQLILLSTEKSNLKDLTDLTKQLKQARDEAEAAKMAESEFFALMSHEMRTPLNGVTAALELIDSKLLTGESAKMLAIAKNSTSGLKYVIDQVLNYSKLQAGGFKNEPRLFDLSEMVHSVVEMLRPKARESATEITISMPEIDRMMSADAAKVRQILVNVLGNAIKFTTNGQINVGVEIADDAKTFSVSVKDNGIGIPPEILPKVFDRFQTFDTHREDIKGTGLGLDICRQFAELMGGSIDCTSEAKKGSEFVFNIPFEWSDEQVEPHATTRATVFSGSVLLAEDNQTNQYLQRLMLEKRGLSVTVVGNGVEAVEAALSSNFDLILMDVSMPVMDGLEATAAIRHTYDKSQLAIVALTAHAQESELQRFVESGMNAALSKPVNVAELEEVLSTYCSSNIEIEAMDAESKPISKEGTSSLSQLIDFSALQKLGKEVGTSTARDIADMFQQEAQAVYGHMQEAKQLSNYAQLAKKAHSIRSSAALLGCSELATELKQLELAASAGKLDEAEFSYQRITSIFNDSLEALKVSLTELPD